MHNLKYFFKKKEIKSGQQEEIKSGQQEEIKSEQQEKIQKNFAIYSEDPDFIKFFQKNTRYPILTGIPTDFKNLVKEDVVISNAISDIARFAPYLDLEIKQRNKKKVDKEDESFRKYLKPIIAPINRIFPKKLSDIVVDFWRSYLSTGIWGIVICEDWNGNYVETYLPSSIEYQNSISDVYFEVSLNNKVMSMKFQYNVEEKSWLYKDKNKKYFLYPIYNYDKDIDKVVSPLYAHSKIMITLQALIQFQRDIELNSFRPHGIISVESNQSFSKTENWAEINKDLDDLSRQISKQNFDNGITLKFWSKFFSVKYIQTQQNIDINGLMQKMNFFISLIAYNLGSSRTAQLDQQGYSSNVALTQNQIFENLLSGTNFFLDNLTTSFLHPFLSRKENKTDPTLNVKDNLSNLNFEWYKNYYLHADVSSNPEWSKRIINQITEEVKGNIMTPEDGNKILSQIKRDEYGFELTPPEYVKKLSTPQDNVPIKNSKDTSQIADKLNANSDKKIELP